MFSLRGMKTRGVFYMDSHESHRGKFPMFFPCNSMGYKTGTLFCRIVQGVSSTQKLSLSSHPSKGHPANLVSSGKWPVSKQRIKILFKI